MRASCVSASPEALELASVGIPDTVQLCLLRCELTLKGSGWQLMMAAVKRTGVVDTNGRECQQEDMQAERRSPLGLTKRCAYVLLLFWIFFLTPYHIGSPDLGVVL